MLEATRKHEIDKEILSLEFCEENLDKLKDLFERRRKYDHTSSVR
jgi:hypothetical protein